MELPEGAPRGTPLGLRGYLCKQFIEKISVTSLCKHIAPSLFFRSTLKKPVNISPSDNQNTAGWSQKDLRRILSQRVFIRSMFVK